MFTIYIYMFATQISSNYMSLAWTTTTKLICKYLLTIFYFLISKFVYFVLQETIEAQTNKRLQ